MSRKNKRLYVFFAVVFFTVVSCAALSLSFGASHVCGGDCAVCRDLTGLKLLSCVPCAALASYAAYRLAAAAELRRIRRTESFRRTDTLVTRKTELLR